MWWAQVAYRLMIKGRGIYREAVSLKYIEFFSRTLWTQVDLRKTKWLDKQHLLTRIKKLKYVAILNSVQIEVENVSMQ